jgi:hypothetical protein
MKAKEETKKDAIKFLSKEKSRSISKCVLYKREFDLLMFS